MRSVRRLLAAAILVAVVLGIVKLASLNDAIVSVRYFWGVTDVALWQALLVAFVTGFALASLGWLVSGLRATLVQRRYRKAVGRLESQVHELRNLPLAPGAEGEASGEGRDTAVEPKGRGR